MDIKKINISQKQWIFFAIFSAVSLIGYFSISHHFKKNKEIPIVSVCHPIQEKIPLVLSIPSILTTDVVELKSRNKGELVEINCKEGGIVEKDQLLFKIDDTLLTTQKKQETATLNKIQSQLTLFEKQLERRTGLLKKGVHSQEQWDNIKAQVDSAKADVALSEAKIEALNIQIKVTNIKAPFSGSIGFIKLQKGDYIQENETVPLAVVQKTAILESFLSIPEQFVKKIIKIPSGAYKIKIHDINNDYLCDACDVVVLDQKIEESTGTLSLKVFVDNKNMVYKPGMTIHAKIECGQYDSEWTLPSKAVFQTEQGNSTYIYDEKQEAVFLKPIEVESILGEKALIKTPLNENELYVTEGQINLHNNMKVSVKK